MAEVIGSNSHDTIDASDGVTDNIDTIHGLAGKDTIFGLGGNDYINGGAGADYINGGPGSDTATYAGSSTGVSVNLATGATDGGYAEGDTLVSIENLDGSELDDGLVGDSGDNSLYGNTGDDSLKGGSGSDTLTGGEGADHLEGGTGIDTARYWGSDSAVTVSLATGAGTGGHAHGDTLLSIENLEGSTHGDILVGNSGVNRLFGHNGNDTLKGGGGADTLYGGAGHDMLKGGGGADVLNGEAGIDTAAYNESAVGVVANLASGGTAGDALGDQFYGIENLIGSNHVDTLHGDNASNVLRGLDGNDVLTGYNGTDTLVGGNGADSLNGGIGADTLYGDAGHDTLQGGLGGDTLDGGSGVDTAGYGGSAVGVIVSLLAHTASGGDATGDQLNSIENLAGSSHADILRGDNGNNVLDGRGGADTLRGELGNDVYYVDDADDVIVEAAGQGADDYLRVSTSYALAAGAEVETLSTVASTATTAINLTGNEISNTVIGNAGDNILDGGAGLDTLKGLAGNDSYFVDHASEKIIEAAGEGTDNVNASVSYVLSASVAVETLRTTDANGTAALNLTGNELANFVTGNDGKNSLNGGGGADTLTGNGGNDSYTVDNAADVIVEVSGEGIDNVNTSVDYKLAAGVSAETLRTIDPAATTVIHLTGNEINNFVTGNAGVNQLNGGLGNDTLTGNAGKDFFLFNTALNSTTNVDTIVDFSVADDTFRLDNAIFKGLAAGAVLDTDAFHIGAAAADAEDRIIYNDITGVLSFDTNGNAAGGATQFAQISTGLALTNADIVVV